MIGPGTGVAPFISYLEYREKLYEKSDKKSMPISILFFGSCYKEKEFYYENYLNQLV
jgi:methionine synthase reductase